MRRGWSILRQEEAVEMAEEALSSVTGGDYRDTRFKEYDMKDILSYLADGERFLQASSDELTDLFDEVNFRYCMAHNIKPAILKLCRYERGSYLYGASNTDGEIKLFCLLDKDQVEPNNYNHIGFLYLAYMYHELRHHYQYCVGEKFFENFLDGKKIKMNIILDACCRMNFIKHCYSWMGAKLDDFYEFNTTERDANYCAFNILTNLIKEYPEFEDQISAGLIDMCNFYLQIENSQCVDVVENELKCYNYYIKNFVKDFSSSVISYYGEWLIDFDQNKFRDIRQKQKQKVLKFIEKYTNKEYEKALSNDNLFMYHIQIKKMKQKYSTFQLNVGLRLLKVYDYDLDRVDLDLAKLYFGGAEALLKGESYQPKKSSVDINSVQIIYNK